MLDLLIPSPSELTATAQLEPVLENRLWLRRDWPYPYVVANNVFTQPFYAAMEAEYSLLLHSGLSEGSKSGTFSRSIAGYDAYGIGLGPSTGGALSVFRSRAWHDLVAGLFDVAATGHINIGAHHHKTGSQSGWIHNDLNPVWFPSNAGGPVRHPDHSRCAYKTGAGPLQASEKVEVVRAVAMLFYLCNEGWQEGDGGETGLFESVNSTEPCLTVAPRNNSILFFECTPRSYHSFLENPGLERNSIIMWVHRTMQDAIARWPGDTLERWSL